MLKIYKDTARQYEEYQKAASNLNIDELNQRIESIDRREWEAKQKQAQAERIMQEAQEELARAKVAYNQTADQIKAELRKELQSRMKQAMEFVTDPITPVTEGN